MNRATFACVLLIGLISLACAGDAVPPPAPTAAVEAIAVAEEAPTPAAAEPVKASAQPAASSSKTLKCCRARHLSGNTTTYDALSDGCSKAFAQSAGTGMVGDEYDAWFADQFEPWEVYSGPECVPVCCDASSNPMEQTYEMQPKGACHRPAPGKCGEAAAAPTRAPTRAAPSTSGSLQRPGGATPARPTRGAPPARPTSGPTQPTGNAKTRPR